MSVDEQFEDIRKKMVESEARIIAAIAASERRSQDLAVEAMRNMQTELLRGMVAYSGSITLRVRKVESDQSNLDAALSGRVEILEKRLGEIEQRLGAA